MNEWKKVLLGAVVGMLTGIAAEPLKSWLVFRYKMSLIRRLLYRELAPIMWQIRGFVATKAGSQSPEDHHYVFWWLRGLNFDVFEHIYAAERQAFYGLPECSLLKMAFEDLKAIATYASESPDKKIEYLQNMSDHFEEHKAVLKQSQFDRSIKTYSHLKPSTTLGLLDRLRTKNASVRGSETGRIKETSETRRPAPLHSRAENPALCKPVVLASGLPVFTGATLQRQIC